ncbi:hypothetical protein M422DRAFT_775081 [Sphaerobolus stellatus SS14]|nr:hypothetical protein M422DRAFT_775081 [Sphaerobolus stellatus SS14]
MNTIEAEFVLLHTQANRYYTAAATTLVLYHYVLTFENECRYAWQQRKALPFYLFLIFRYLPPFVFLIDQGSQYLDASGFFPSGPPVSVCRLWWPRLIMGPIVTFTTGIILIMRVYAVYRRNQRVLCVTGSVFIGQVGVNIWSIWKESQVAIPGQGFGCISWTEAAFPRSSLLPIFISAMIFNLAMFMFTMNKQFSLGREGLRPPLMLTVVRDGNLYFIALFLVNSVTVLLIIISLAFPNYGPSPRHGSEASYVGTINVQFAAAVTSVLVSNLFLNLREVAYRHAHISHPSTLYPPSSLTQAHWSMTTVERPSSIIIIGRSESFHSMDSKRSARKSTLRKMLDVEDLAMGLPGPGEKELHCPKCERRRTDIE